MIVVDRPGMLTTVQDLGRWGHQASGVPVAGPMDAWSHRLANLLLGNPPEAAVLEVTITGPTFECVSATRLAITGASFELVVGGQTYRCPATLELPPRTTVAFGRRLAGARAYVAVEGGFDVPAVLGSRSTDLRAGFGGQEGRALRAGDRLLRGGTPTAPSRLAPQGDPLRPRVREVTAAGVGSARDAVTRLRVLDGDQPSAARKHAYASLLGRAFSVSTRSDRMGYRLEGPAVARGGTGLMITAPTVMGLVQVPPGGEPILLMADRQTTGGYVPGAVVITADLPRAGQLAPGQNVVFESCTYEAARRALEAAEARLAAVGAAP